MKSNYDNSLRGQIFDIQNLVPAQYDISLGVARELVEALDFSKIKNIIITGCGDSYLAAVEATAAFKKYNNKFGIRTQALRAIDAARYHSLEKDTDSTVVIAISNSGRTARLAEVIQRAKSYGVTTIALTSKDGSPVTVGADHVFNVNTPEFEHRSPGLRSYVSCLLSLFVLSTTIADKLGETESHSAELYEALISYNNDYSEVLDRIDDEIFSFAREKYQTQGFEILGDGPLFTTAEFVAAKLAEVSGDICTVIDSENYMHVNTFLRPGAAHVTIAMGYSDEPNYSQVLTSTETAATRDERPILFISDKKSEVSGESVSVDSVVIPLPPVDHRYVGALYSYIPGSLLAGYQAQLHDEPFFRGGGKWADPTINTLSSNEIKIV